jgi:hypothetical protein
MTKDVYRMHKRRLSDGWVLVLFSCFSGRRQKKVTPSIVERISIAREIAPG